MRPVDGSSLALSAIDLMFTIGKPVKFFDVEIVPIDAQTACYD